MTEILNETLFSYGEGWGCLVWESKRLQGDLRATWTFPLVMCRSSWEEHFLLFWRVFPVLMTVTKLRASRCCVENVSMLTDKCCRILRVFGHVWQFFTHFQDLTGTTGSQTWQSSFPRWMAFRWGFDSFSEGRRRKMTMNQNVIWCRCGKILRFSRGVRGWQALLHPAQSAGEGQEHLQRPDVNSWEQPLNLFPSLFPCIPVEHYFLTLSLSWSWGLAGFSNCLEAQSLVPGIPLQDQSWGLQHHV